MIHGKVQFRPTRTSLLYTREKKCAQSSQTSINAIDRIRLIDCFRPYKPISNPVCLSLAQCHRMSVTSSIIFDSLIFGVWQLFDSPSIFIIPIFISFNLISAEQRRQEDLRPLMLGVCNVSDGLLKRKRTTNKTRINSLCFMGRKGLAFVLIIRHVLLQRTNVRTDIEKAAQGFWIS